MSISGPRGSIAVQRTYRSLTSNTGSFGLGNELQYVWQLDTSTPASVSAVNLVSPKGNRFLFSLQGGNTFACTTVPWLSGAVMTANAGQETDLRLKAVSYTHLDVYKRQVTRMSTSG